MERIEKLIWKRFTLKEAILLGFCATFILLTRVGLRLHLHLPGHVMLFMTFFLLLSRGCVPKTGAATLVGLIASIGTLALGMSNGSPLILVKFLLPALLVDLAAICYPGFAVSYAGCLTIGIIASAVRSLSVSGLEFLLGVEDEIILQQALITALVNCLYAAAGAAIVPPVVKRLQANSLIARSPA
ncbi:hypothetical protein LPW11_02035 [Geomonas sp. RF6]|uniref:hypothetical protein n=1 Tax=Geomonas sp. RF6 TaxID=2897342 RepID=UPI001E42D9C8|nr:hypothetical protein [Geomonas sp. RF6]UFS70977.1 hypothetical protein LPW11_02035 [Geomonas sp. RF6]